MPRFQQTLQRRNPMQCRKKNLWTQTINQNKWQIRSDVGIIFRGSYYCYIFVTIGSCFYSQWSLLFTFQYFSFVFKRLHHHHHVVLVARISLTLSRHFSLSFIASGRSSGQHPVSSHSCWMYVRAGGPDFARPCVGVHKSISLMSSSLLLQQCPSCLVRLT